MCACMRSCVSERERGREGEGEREREREYHGGGERGHPESQRVGRANFVTPKKKGNDNSPVLFLREERRRDGEGEGGKEGESQKRNRMTWERERRVVAQRT